MIGWINASIQVLVTEKFGDDVWQEVLKESGLSGHWYLLQSYQDGDTVKLVAAASKVLELEIDTVLHTSSCLLINSILFIYYYFHFRSLRYLGHFLSHF